MSVAIAKVDGIRAVSEVCQEGVYRMGKEINLGELVQVHPADLELPGIGVSASRG